MALLGGFFPSQNGDRRYQASYFASYFASFIGNGVFSNPSTNLQVVASTGRQVRVYVGKAWINGYYLNSNTDVTLTLAGNTSGLRRIDRVVVRLNLTDREITINVKEGTPSATPTAPDLTRNNLVYELALADVSLGPNVTNLSQSAITDTRSNSELCGFVTGVVNRVDTTTLFNQYQEALNQVIADANQSLDDFNQDSSQVLNNVQQVIDDAIAATNSANNVANQLNPLIPEVQYFTNQQTNLQAQLNNIVNNPNNGTETVQARVGYDGTIYSTLKERLDTEGNLFLRHGYSPTSNIQPGANTQTLFQPFQFTSANTLTTSLLNNNNQQYGYVTRTTLNTSVEVNPRLGMNVTNNNRVTFENGKRYRITFKARANRLALLNYVYLLNAAPVANVNLSNSTGNVNVGPDFKEVTYNFAWTAATTTSQLLIGSTALNQNGDWLEIVDLIIHEGFDMIPYKPPFTLSNTVGNMYSLQTSNKNDLVSAINEVFQGVDNGKNLIAAAITDKGVQTQGTATFQTMAANINNISSEPSFVTGTTTSSGGMSAFDYITSGNQTMYTLNIVGIGFVPSSVVAYPTARGSSYNVTRFDASIHGETNVITVYNFSNGSSNSYSRNFKGNSGNAILNASTVALPVSLMSTNYTYVAYR